MLEFALLVHDTGTALQIQGAVLPAGISACGYPTKAIQSTCLNSAHRFSGPTCSPFISLSWQRVLSIHMRAHACQKLAESLQLHSPSCSQAPHPNGFASLTSLESFPSVLDHLHPLPRLSSFHLPSPVIRPKHKVSHSFQRSNPRL